MNEPINERTDERVNLLNERTVGCTQPFRNTNSTGLAIRPPSRSFSHAVLRRPRMLLDGTAKAYASLHDKYWKMNNLSAVDWFDWFDWFVGLLVGWLVGWLIVWFVG